MSHDGHDAVQDAAPQAAQHAPRTYLFAPGSRPERFDKAFASGADAVVLDLEDAVAPEDKPRARDAVAAWLRNAAPALRSRAVLRINDATSAAFADDLRMLAAVMGASAVATAAADAPADDRLSVMLAKTESAQQPAALRDLLPTAGVMALIESARGVAEVDAIAAAGGVTRLVFGTLDFALDLGVETGGAPLALAHLLSYAASRIAIASRVAGLAPPVAGVTPEIDDEALLLADLALARQHGFGAKLCIHPKQVAPIHRALLPSEAELDWARRALAAEQASPGAARLDGRMVDRPVVLRAQRLLDRARC